MKRVVLITGAAGGLGRALTSAFANAGWLVAAAGHQSAPAGLPEKAVGFAVEVTEKESVTRLFVAVDQQFGRLDALVYNAGLNLDGLCAQFSVDAWDDCLGVNLRGAFHCAQAAAERMRRQREGHVIQIGSFAARGAAGNAAYSAAKAGLIGLGTSLARELGGRNIRVNTVFPGVLRTAMTAGLSPGRLQEFAEANTLGRLNEVEEVARFVAHLADTRNISGQVFQLDSRISRWT